MSDLLIRRRNLLMKRQEEEMNIRAVCFKADGEQTVAITKVGSAPKITMQYSYDGVNWDNWDLSALPFGGNTKVYLRGMGNYSFGIDSSRYNKITFGTDSYVYVSGIAEALLDGENEVLSATATGLLRNLFYEQSALRSAENLRLELKTVPSVYLTTYAFMFAKCTNLLYAPKALSIERFGAGYECASMFQDCTSLLTAPELPATTLRQYCYRYMFKGCKSLKAIRCMAKVKAQGATEDWVVATAPSGTFYGHAEYGWSSGASGIPTTWTFEELTD